MDIVLGGTHGLGWEIARLLKEQGRDVFVVGRSYDASLHGKGMKVDVSDMESAQAFTKFLHEAHGLNSFYWVAGYGYNGDFAKQTDVERMVAVNFAAVVPIAQVVWRKMQASGKTSHFVVVSSTTGTKARADEAVYAATKHAQAGFARSLGMESERLKSKIKVALFLPGGMRTPFWDGNRPAGYDAFLDPAKVAARIVSSVRNQSDHFLEDRIERGIL